MAKIEASAARFSASLKAIEDAKHRTVVIDTILPKSRKVVSGPTKKIYMKAAETVETVETVETEKKPVAKAVERLPYYAPKERTLKKKSNIGKLLKGKKFSFDK